MGRKDGRLSGYTITKKGGDEHHELEVGLVFLERCYKLLMDGGRLGIILPETYWFSSSYAWLRNWLEGRFVLRGMFNVPMEAFQSFCRAKTNLYILEKVSATGDSGDVIAPRPSWYRAGQVVVSSAPKCGINKDGIDRVIVGPKQVGVDDILYEDALALRAGEKTPTTRVVPLAEVLEPWRGVPTHFDQSSLRAFEAARADFWPGWSEMTLGQMIDEGWISRRYGHGSPSKDQRQGVIPYIKVSDLRAGLVNVNSTNMVSAEVAEALWHGSDSGLEAFDLLSPERASSNIGEFCVLMPGQERVVLTREVIVLRVTDTAPFDAFYLLWALSLQVVRDQWRRVIFMQTNREDVGNRYREIIVPLPPSTTEADAVSQTFRQYFVGLSRLRAEFAHSLSADGLHYLTLAGPNPSGDGDEDDTEPTGPN